MVSVSNFILSLSTFTLLASAFVIPSSNNHGSNGNGFGDHGDGHRDGNHFGDGEGHNNHHGGGSNWHHPYPGRNFSSIIKSKPWAGVSTYTIPIFTASVIQSEASTFTFFPIYKSTDTVSSPIFTPFTDDIDPGTTSASTNVKKPIYTTSSTQAQVQYTHQQQVQPTSTTLTYQHTTSTSTAQTHHTTSTPTGQHTTSTNPAQHVTTTTQFKKDH